MLAADLHLFQSRQLAQAGVKHGVGLDLAQGEGGDQLRLRLVLEADDADHLVEVQVDDQQAFQDMQALLDLRRGGSSSAADQDLAAMVEKGLQRLGAGP